MIDYFAYGSNMARDRLQARVGEVEFVGVAQARGFAHSFTKLGRDGTGKGNITLDRHGVVHGVVYRLTADQMVELRRYEGGYEQFSLTVTVMVPVAPVPPSATQNAAGAPGHRVESFRAIRPVDPLRPTRQYVAFYEQAMREHDLPREYCSFILEQARTLWRMAP